MAAAERHELRLSGGPESPAVARRALVQWLRGRAAPAALQDAKLLVSEVVTNGVRHAPDGELLLRVEVGERIRVELTDPGTGFSRPDPSEPDERSIGGRGFVLIDRIAASWGVSSNGRNTVWFELQPKNTDAVS